MQIDQPTPLGFRTRWLPPASGNGANHGDPEVHRWFCFSLDGTNPLACSDLVAWLAAMPEGDARRMGDQVGEACQLAATQGKRTEFVLDYRLRRGEGWGCYRGRIAAIPGSRTPFLRLVGIEEDLEYRRISDEEVEVRLAHRSELMSTVVHDLRAPLTVLSASINLLRTRTEKELDQQTRQELLVHMERSCHRMERLLRSLLDVAAAESGHLDLERCPVPLMEFMNEFVQAHRPGAAVRGVLLQWAPLVELPPVVHFDPDRIEQVLENLVGNALKFSPSGGAICIFVAVGEKGLEFSVEDEGPGIAPEERATLFRPFVRGNQYDNCEQSTGLGLAICHRLIEAHGGEIWVENRADRGAAFKFRLPAA